MNLGNIRLISSNIKIIVLVTITIIEEKAFLRGNRLNISLTCLPGQVWCKLTREPWVSNNQTPLAPLAWDEHNYDEDVDDDNEDDGKGKIKMMILANKCTFGLK